MERQHVDFTPRLPANVVVENPSRDYTPPSASLPRNGMLVFWCHARLRHPTLVGFLTPKISGATPL